MNEMVLEEWHKMNAYGTSARFRGGSSGGSSGLKSIKSIIFDTEELKSLRQPKLYMSIFCSFRFKYLGQSAYGGSSLQIKVEFCH